jgi:hypothetical protein
MLYAVVFIMGKPFQLSLIFAGWQGYYIAVNWLWAFILNSINQTVNSVLLSKFYSGIDQRSLTEGEGSVQLTSLSLLVKISCFSYWSYIFPFLQTTYLNEEVNRTQPSPSVRVPWIDAFMIYYILEWYLW